MPLPLALQGDRWTEYTARNILPMLVWCAKHGKKITYGQLDQEIQRRKLGHHVNVVVYGHPAGAIGNALLETEAAIGEKIPPINSLVVNAKSGIPGAGCDYYLKTYLARRNSKELTDAQRKSMAEDTIEEIWRYQGWDEILKGYGLKALSGGIPALESNRPSKQGPTKGGWSSEPESEEHAALKVWVSKNPNILKSKIPFKNGITEWLYASADRVDVMFKHVDGCVAVEVKSIKSNDADLERGIYQCVKYQSLLRAELKAAGEIPNGHAILVTERQLPEPLVQLADLLGVRVVEVPQKRG